MGVDPLTALFVGASLFSAFSQIQSGNAEQDAFEQESALQEQQALIAQDESEAKASRTADEARKFRKKQKLAFLASGVTLEGSPLLVLEETRAKSQEEVDAILNRGTAQSRLLNQQAQISRNRGRSALVSAQSSAFGTATKGIFTATQLGGGSKDTKEG